MTTQRIFFPKVLWSTLLSLWFFLPGCNPYYYGRVRDWRPAEIELSATLRKVALVNRANIPPAERKRIMEDYTKRSIAEGALQGALRGSISGAAYGATGGAMGGLLDERWLERAPQASLTRLHDRLKECGQLQPLMAGQELSWTGSTEGSLPPPLPMDSLKTISRRVPEAQGIIALETLLPSGSTQRPEVLVGFRLYDAKSGKVIDEVTLTSGTTYKYGGIAQAHIDAVEAYIHRICPCFTAYGDRTVRFYVKGSPNLEKAKAAIIGRSWSEAIALWEADASSAKASAAKRAAYNLAVLYDALCEVEKAEEWYRRAVGAGLGQNEYAEWGRTRKGECQRLNSQLPREKRAY